MPEQLRNIHIFCAGILTNLSTIHTDTMVSSQQGQTNTHVDMKANPDLVSERQSNLPLPEQPPVASDFNSASAANSAGSGAVESGISSGGSLRSPATGDASGAGREGKDGLSGIPNDAVSRDQKDHKGLEPTTGKDSGYPGNADPSSAGKQ
jgi:hypothetical protein